MIQVSFSFNSHAEAMDFLAGLGSHNVAEMVAPTVTKGEEPKPVKTRVSKKKAEPVVDIPNDDFGLDEPSAPAKEYSFEDIAALAKKHLKEKGSESLIKILAQFKAKKVTDVSPAQYATLAEALA